jgi:hypothetical protein
MTTKQATAMPVSAGISENATWGKEIAGSPPGTGPRIAMPYDERSNAKLTIIAPVTAMRAPGTRVPIIRATRMTAITEMERISVGRWIQQGTDPEKRRSCTSVPYWSWEMPVIAATCPIAIWMPTPVRKPIRTVRERKSATNPILKRLAAIRRTPERSAIIAAYPTYSDDFGAAMAIRLPAIIAAVAESAPTTRWRDEPKNAKTAIGKKIV